MIGIALQRRVRDDYYETMIVNPYHISSYIPWYNSTGPKNCTKVYIGHGQQEFVKETFDEIAQLVAVATSIKVEDTPPDVYYVSTDNLIKILGYIERDRDKNYANI